MNFKRILYFSFLFIFVNACATLKMQVSKNQEFKKNNTSKIVHSFYLIGDAGNSSLGKKDAALIYLEEELKKATKNSTLVFLGDNVYQKGIPKKGSKNYKLAKHRLKVQTDIGKNFIGNTVMIPGNHDWYHGLKGLKREEKLVEKALGKNTFLPENGCPLEKINISKDIILILIDTHWFVTNWNNHPGINDACEIKTREKFLSEFGSLVKKARGKTTLIAMHHPMFTNGPHGGYYSFKSHLKPLPVLGTIKNILRKTTGVTNTDQQNKKYNELKKRIVTISQANEKVIFVSGHEHSLQYIVRDNIPQIVSGSGSKKTATNNVNGGKFSYGTEGFARLDVYKDGASSVHFYSEKDKKIVFEANVISPDSVYKPSKLSRQKSSSKKASIYGKEQVKKGKIYEFLWGKRYRKYYGTEINAKTVYLDTLFGGLKPVKKGGGNQSRSLRLEDKNGKEYVMRALKKNAVQFLQNVAFKGQYIEKQFEKTYSEGLLLDIFTASHPYAPFTIETLADAAEVYHSNPQLYYIPKQLSLGAFNTDFGDELYMIEERSASGHGDLKSFGFSNKIISTDALRTNLAKDEKYVIDEESYIRARLFDMLIGDWDRHQDQWRWAEFKINNKLFYRPVPRDRDQSFAVFGDGILLNFITKAIPTLRGMQSYSDDIKNPKSFNWSAYALDLLLIKNADKSIWDAQVSKIQSQVTDEVIDEAFKNFPTEVQDESITEIRRKLRGRRKNLQQISDKYFKQLNKLRILTGTNKDDWFTVERFENGDTKVSGFRIKKGKKAGAFHEKVYSNSTTKEIWIYGLDDTDVFEVFGTSGKKSIKVKIIGGLDNDVYDIRNSKNTKVYDHKSKKNTFKTKNINKKRTDDYQTNTFSYRKTNRKLNQILPAIGYNPDDGMKIGFKNTYTVNAFERNPFTSQHTISSFYYFATNGYELNYSGEFANVFKNWNLGIAARFNSPNFAVNFFGYGNNSLNPEAGHQNNDAQRDFNRVRIQQIKFGTFVQWRGELGAKVKLSANYQNFKVARTANRFLETQFAAGNIIFKPQQFLNTEATYKYKHSDNPAFPTLGMEFDAKIGFTKNLQNENAFSYASSSVSITHKISPNGRVILASKIDGNFIFGKDFEFYQASTIGGNNGLRGFRNERFTGKNAFYHSTDIRYNLRSIKTNLLPIQIGFFGGFDYGMVWDVPNMFLTPPRMVNKINTSYGAGFFLNAVNMMAINIGAFNSSDGVRIAFNLGFDL